jgi:mannose-6-phosphate isomerase-like protein (cupin superfamily)
MMRVVGAALAAISLGLPVPAAAQPAAAGVPATYVSLADLTAVLKKAEGTPQSDATVKSVPVGAETVLVNIGHRAKEGATMVGVQHDTFTEVYHVIEGTGTLITGGTFVNPEKRPGGNTRGTIQNGVTQRITVGDVIVIPLGTPHTFSDIEKTVVFLNVGIVPKAP